MRKQLNASGSRIVLDIPDAHLSHHSRIPTSTTSNRSKLQDFSNAKKPTDFSMPLRNEKLIESLSKNTLENEIYEISTQSSRTGKQPQIFSTKSNKFNFPDIFSRPQTASSDGFLKIQKLSLSPTPEHQFKPSYQKFTIQSARQPTEKAKNIPVSRLLSNESRDTDPFFDQRRDTNTETDVEGFNEELRQHTEQQISLQIDDFAKNQPKTRYRIFSPQQNPIAHQMNDKYVRPNTAVVTRPINEIANETDAQSSRTLPNEELLEKLVNMQVLRNNQAISREKIQTFRGNSSVKAHIQSLTKKGHSRVCSAATAATSRPTSSNVQYLTAPSQRQLQITSPRSELHSRSHSRLDAADLPTTEYFPSQPKTTRAQDNEGQKRKNTIKTPSEDVPPRLSIGSIDRVSSGSQTKKRKTIASRISIGKKTIKAEDELMEKKISKPTSIIDDFLNKDPSFEGDEIAVKQTNVENHEGVKKVIEMDPEIQKEFTESIEKIEGRFRYLVSEEEKNKDVKNPEDIDFLKDIEVRMIKEEMLKAKTHPDEVDWDKLDSLVVRLKFFAKFSKPVRMTLLKNSEYCFYPRNSIVFQQGDYGDVMYVILRGSCNVRTIRTTPYGTQEDIVVNCIYDGEKFGELAMMGTRAKAKDQGPDHLAELQAKVKGLKQVNFNREQLLEDQMAEPEEMHVINEQLRKSKVELQKTMEEKEIEQVGLKVGQDQAGETEEKAIFPTYKEDRPMSYYERTKRSATIQVAESADMLAIPREKFKDILLSLIQRELDVKIKVLMCLPFFEKMEPFSLIPVANNIVTKTYKMGEIILQEGETPKELCIVASGVVKVVKEVTASRVLKPSSFAKGRIPAQRNFKFGKTDFIPDDDGERLPEEVKKKNKVVEANRAFKFDIVKVDEEKNRIYYKEFVEFASLTRGEFFGGRALLGEEVAKDGFEFEEFLKKIPKAQLSVIADSSSVEVYTIDKKQLLYVPDNIKQTFTEGLTLCREFDDHPIESQTAAMQEWNSFKENEVLSYLKEKYYSQAFVQDFKKY